MCIFLYSRHFVYAEYILIQWQCVTTGRIRRWLFLRVCYWSESQRTGDCRLGATASASHRKLWWRTGILRQNQVVFSFTHPRHTVPCFTYIDCLVDTRLPRLLESPGKSGIFFLKLRGPGKWNEFDTGKSWKLKFEVLESPEIYLWFNL